MLQQTITNAHKHSDVFAYNVKIPSRQRNKQSQSRLVSAAIIYDFWLFRRFFLLFVLWRKSQQFLYVWSSNSIRCGILLSMKRFFLSCMHFSLIHVCNLYEVLICPFPVFAALVRWNNIMSQIVQTSLGVLVFVIDIVIDFVIGD